MHLEFDTISASGEGLTAETGNKLEKKTLAVLQPGYLPWLGFFDQLARSDVFVFYDDVQYDKNGWRNRNRIKTPAGPHWLTVPVNVKHLGQRICDVEIENRSNWSKKHLGSIRQYYGKAPYFKDYFPAIESLLEQQWEKIIDLDLALIDQFVQWFGIDTEFYRSSQLNVQGERNERLLNLCLRFGAERYLSGNAAQDYLDVDLFKSSGVEVCWQNYQHPVYPQILGDFIPYLSALDLLLNCGKESAEIIKTAASCTNLSDQQET